MREEPEQTFPAASTGNAPASLFGVIAASFGARPGWVRFWSYLGLGFEIAVGVLAWQHGSNAVIAFVIANVAAALHLPFYQTLSQRGPPGSVRSWQKAVPFLLFNAYALAAVLTAHAFAPVALVLFAVTALSISPMTPGKYQNSKGLAQYDTECRTGRPTRVA